MRLTDVDFFISDEKEARAKPKVSYKKVNALVKSFIRHKTPMCLVEGYKDVISCQVLETVLYKAIYRYRCRDNILVRRHDNRVYLCNKTLCEQNNIDYDACNYKQYEEEKEE